MITSRNHVVYTLLTERMTLEHDKVKTTAQFDASSTAAAAAAHGPAENR